MATTEAENKEIVRKLPEEPFSEGNLDIINEIVTDEYVVHGTGAREPIHGPEGVKELASMVRTAFPDIEVPVEDITVEDDKKVRRDCITGTLDGTSEWDRAVGRKRGWMMVSGVPTLTLSIHRKTTRGTRNVESVVANRSLNSRGG